MICVLWHARSFLNFPRMQLGSTSRSSYRQMGTCFMFERAQILQKPTDTHHFPCRLKSMPRVNGFLLFAFAGRLRSAGDTAKVREKTVVL
jgi:hypothetical protein